MRLALPYFRSECRARVENLVPNLSAQKRGKMGHPFVWLGWETQGPSTALGMTDLLTVKDFLRDDRLLSGPHAGEGARATWFV
jgi:hypothetical protein